MNEISRRQFMTTVGATAAGTIVGARYRAASSHGLPSVQTITRGPQYHWFGYCDKLEFDPTNRYVLSNEVDFEHRTPAADDTIRIGMIDTSVRHPSTKVDGVVTCTRTSRDGLTVAIDSPHRDGGRQVHLIDVGKIVT